MAVSAWIAVPVGILFVAFVVFALRQGTKVPRSGDVGTGDTGLNPPSD